VGQPAYIIIILKRSDFWIVLLDMPYIRSTNQRTLINAHRNMSTAMRWLTNH